MHRVNAIIVGAGPSGAGCAWALRRMGIECLLLYREKFPRLKLCGGLVTPEALDDLEFGVGDYPHSHFTIARFCFHYRNRQLTLKSQQHSIRRVEFDDWLVTRSGVGLHRHYVRSIVRDGDYFVLDDAYRCRYLIGRAVRGALCIAASFVTWHRGIQSCRFRSWKKSSPTTGPTMPAIFVSSKTGSPDTIGTFPGQVGKESVRRSRPGCVLRPLSAVQASMTCAACRGTVPEAC